MFEIACETGWSHESILDLPVVAGFYYALLATRKRTEAIEGQRLAATFAWMDDKDRRQISQRLQVVLSGPGRLPRWDDGLSPQVKAEMQAMHDELDATLARIVSRGAVPVSAEGQKNAAALFARE